MKRLHNGRPHRKIPEGHGAEGARLSFDAARSEVPSHEVVHHRGRGRPEAAPHYSLPPYLCPGLETGQGTGGRMRAYGDDADRWDRALKR